MKHVVMFSGGLGSWMTAKRVAEQHGTADLFLVFADVGGQHTSPHAGEDEDTYRFIIEAAADALGVALPSAALRKNVGELVGYANLVSAGWVPGLVVLNEGRDIWQVFTDNRFLGNSRLANCSKFLKQQPARAWLDANCDPDDTTVYVGIDWTETHRVPAIVNAYLPYKAEAPLTEPPYLSRDDMVAACEAEGIAIPRLYRAGFPHNNCGGFCVRAGQAQMELLLREHPERFAYHEGKEEELRQHLGKDVAVLRDRSGGKSVPLTLRRFRERVQMQPELFDDLDWGGCGCFVDEPTKTEETA